MAEENAVIDRDALLYVLSLPQGRKVLWDILGQAGLFRQPFSVENERLTAFNCGNLNIGIMVYAELLQTSPDLTAMMTKEQANADARNLSDARANADSGSSAITHPRDHSNPGGGDPEDRSSFHGLGSRNPGTILGSDD